MTHHGGVLVTTTSGAIAAKCTGMCSFILLATGFVSSALPWFQAFALITSGIAGVISIALGIRAWRDHGPKPQPGQPGLIGPTGDQGPIGYQGVTGEKGPTGDKGAAGKGSK